MPNETTTHVQLIGRDNGAGLSRDMVLLADALRSVGVPSTTAALAHRGRLLEAWTRWRLTGRAPRFDLNVMLERVRPEFLRAARHNVLIPNPEYFRAQDRAALSRIDAVWVKTRHAATIFRALDMPVRYIGFTSPDRRTENVPRRHAFFHGPGRSGNKGTQALLELWAANPAWPMLTVAWRRRQHGALPEASNVRLIRDHIDDDTYRRLQNEHRFHLCPSQTEGYGHYIAEAMSCSAVVVTLDAEPMNELVAPNRGVLVHATPNGTQDLATRYVFDGAPMREAIDRCIAMSTDEMDRLGREARAWYEREQLAFPIRLRDALAALG
ncbi:glycosyltransferase [Rhodanobacter sp. L36]|uniref:glycosyltransferase n=1 Tax=Rhodanobacter sp. L36 TaxID=1747221 RepID=UPI00131B3974|nr:glycosyltransferase [Rhodanobacter sp. L36]